MIREIDVEADGDSAVLRIDADSILLTKDELRELIDCGVDVLHMIDEDVDYGLTAAEETYWEMRNGK